MPQYECWLCDEEDGIELSLFPSDSNQKSWLSAGSVWQYSIHADSWEEAMALHHMMQGWEAYRPMPEDSVEDAYERMRAAASSFETLSREAIEEIFSEDYPEVCGPVRE